MIFKLHFYLFIFGFACSLFFSSCEPETIIETETVVVNDTLIVTNTDTVFIDQTDTLFISDETEFTTFILVKHAEIPMTIATDPILTQAGFERAEKLANMLSKLKLNRVYSTMFQRTKQTAMPTAGNQGLEITDYGGFDHESVIDDVLENVNEGIVLIVGHSNTTPNFLNSLTGTSDFEELGETSFDNLFIVHCRSKGDSELTHLKY